MKELALAIKWFDERIGIQAPGKIHIPRWDDSLNIVKYWAVIKRELENHDLKIEEMLKK